MLHNITLKEKPIQMSNSKHDNGNMCPLVSPLEMCAAGGLLGGALGRMFGWSPHLQFVLYRPDRRENVRSESRMVSATYKRTL